MQLNTVRSKKNIIDYVNISVSVSHPLYKKYYIIILPQFAGISTQSFKFGNMNNYVHTE